MEESQGHQVYKGVIEMDDKKHPYYEKDGRRVQTTYHRIFIRNKYPEPPKGEQK